MLAVLPYDPSRPGVARLGEVPDPSPGPGEVLIEVAATALNQADVYQLKGAYPPPRGESEVPGLECAGRVAALGEGVDPAYPWATGPRVMALLAGGGHGERVAAPVGQLLPVPENLSLEEAAALPEAALAAWTNLVAEGALQPGETVMITGATGGMGTFAVQLARELGGNVIAVARDPERLARLRELGIDRLATAGRDLVPQVQELTGGRGVDLVLDFVGGPGLADSLAVLRNRGRLVLLGLTAGTRAELDLRGILSRRLRLAGSVLRARSREEKAGLVAACGVFALPRLADGRLRPVVDRVLPFREIGDAYAVLERGGAFGKVVVALDGAD